jgi:hypothetical protein
VPAQREVFQLAEKLRREIVGEANVMIDSYGLTLESDRE